MTAEIRYFPGLVGCTSFVNDPGATGLMFCLSRDQRKIVVIDMTTSPISQVGESAVIDCEPWRIVVHNSAQILVTCSDGTMRSFTIANTPVQQASWNIGCESDKFLAMLGTCVVAPGPAGTIISINASNVLHRIEGILPEILGLWSNTQASTTMRLYVFGPLGKGRVVPFNSTTGVFGLGNTFISPNIVGHATPFRHLTGTVYLVCVSHDRETWFDFTTDVDNPVFLSLAKRYTNEKPIAPITNGIGSWYRCNETPVDGTVFPYKQGTAIIKQTTITRLGLWAVLPQIGAIMWQNPWPNYDGTLITT